MSAASGSIEVYSDRYETVVQYMHRFAKTLGVEVKLGPERIVGSEGIFRRRYISTSTIEVEGDPHSVKSFAEVVTVFCQDANRR